MANIKELREQMASLATNARDELSSVSDKTDEARAKEVEVTFDKMMADHDAIASRVQRMEKLEAIEAKQEARQEEIADVSKRPVMEARTAPANDEGEQLSYRRAFMNYISKGGNAGLDPESRAVLETRIQKTATSAAGGYTVPTELANFIEKSMIASGPMYSSELFTNLNTASGEGINIPTVDDTAVTAVGPHAEGTAIVDDAGKDVVFSQKQIQAFAFNTEWVRWSHELNSDSLFNMESLLGDLLGERLGRIANSKLTTGSGSSDVEGIVTTSALGKTSASATAITADEIIDLVHSVDPAYRSAVSARIMMNDSTLAAVRKLKDGDGNYLWAMGNYQAGIPQNILGYEVVVNQAMDSLTTAKKVMLFGDMKKFYVRKVGSPTLFVANERFAPDYGILGWARFDGVLTNTAAIKHMKTA